MDKALVAALLALTTLPAATPFFKPADLAAPLGAVFVVDLAAALDPVLAGAFVAVLAAGF